MSDLLTVPEVAERLKVSDAFVYKQLRQGSLKGVQLGSLWRVREKDLAAYLGEPEATESKPETIPDKSDPSESK